MVVVTSQEAMPPSDVSGGGKSEPIPLVSVLGGTCLYGGGLSRESTLWPCGWEPLELGATDVSTAESLGLCQFGEAPERLPRPSFDWPRLRRGPSSRLSGHY